jgi:drug/metabolite transporter (DMT)-like permease
MERHMRLTMIAGVALVVVGAFLLVRGGSFTTHREMMRVGDMSVSAEERRPIEPWLAGVAVVAGIALLATGTRRKA